MKRSAPLQRRTRLRPRRATQRRSERVRDRAYMAWVRERPCVLVGTGECAGRTEAHHAGGRPLGRKADDDTTIPLCRHHHARITDGAYPREARREIERAGLAVTRMAWDAEHLGTTGGAMFVVPLTRGWSLYARSGGVPYLRDRDGVEREPGAHDVDALTWARIVEEWLGDHRQLVGPKADRYDRDLYAAATRAVAVWRGDVIETTTVTE